MNPSAPSLRPRASRRGVCGRVAACAVLVLATGCARTPQHAANRFFDVGNTPLPADLRAEVAAARGSLRRVPAHQGAYAADVAAYLDLDGRLESPTSRPAAGDELYARWRSAPTQFLWIELAARQNRLLRRTRDRNAMYALPALADSATPVGAFVRGLRFYGYGNRGSHFRNAEAGLAALDPLQQVWLQLQLAAVDSDEGDHQGAVRRLLACRERALAIGGRGLEAMLWQNAAEYLRRADRLDGALHAAALAGELAQSAGQDHLALRLRIDVAGILEDRREREAALALLAECAAVATARDYPFLLGLCLDRTAALKAELGDLPGTLASDLRRAEVTMGMRDSLAVPPALISVADDFRRLGQLDSCLTWQRRAATWVERYPNKRNQAVLPVKIATYYCQIGDYPTADSLLAVAGSRAPGASTAPQEAQIQIELLNEALEAGAPELAFRAARRLAQLAPALRDAGQIADGEIAMADFLGQQGEFLLARRALDRALAAVNTRGGETREWEFQRSTGELAVLRGDPQGARDAFGRCLTIAERLGDLDQISASRVRLGQALLSQGQIPAARAVFAADADSTFGGRFRTKLTAQLFQSIVLVQEGSPTAALAALDRTNAMWARRAPADLRARLQLERGRCLAALGKGREAEQALREAFELTPGGRSGTALPEARLFSGNVRRDAAEALIGLMLDHPELLAGRAPALETLAIADAARDVSGPFAPRGALRRPFAAFFVGRHRSFAWTGGPDDADAPRLRQLPGRAALLEAVSGAVSSMERPGRPVDTAALERLGRLLLDGVAEAWPRPTTLTFVPDDVLCAVPWGALPLPGEPVTALEHGPIREAASAWSGGGLPTHDQDQRPDLRHGEGAGRLLAVGRDAPWGDDGGGARSELRDAEAEAREIAALWPAGRAELRVGARSSWEQVVAQGLEGFQVVHIATHAVVREGLPEQGTLRLAGQDEALPLTLPAVSRLRLSAELVYLSCCEAAEGTGGDGGVTDFARAFLTAGAGTVVASTVRVDDHAARRLARHFYEQWLAGQDPPTALRGALLALRQEQPEWGHPYYWAFYRLIER